MTINQFLVLLISICVFLPILLFAVAWRRHYQNASRSLLLPTLSALLLLLAVVRNLKVSLLGPDYSHRLYLTIEFNMVLAIVAAIYFGVTKRWVAVLAALILALDWLYMGIVNSAV